MKKIGLTIVLCAYVFLGLAQETAANLGVAAIGLVVSDIKKSEKFILKL